MSTFLIVCAGIVFGLVALIALFLAVVRVVYGVRRRAQRQLEDRWLPILVRGLDADADPLPTVPSRDMPAFLALWNRLHDSIRGYNSTLHVIALLTGAHDAARHMLKSRRIRERLLAIATLGRLRDRTVWPQLVPLASEPDVTVSLTAAHALVRIDPEQATTLLLPMVASREDWPPATVRLILEEADAAVLSPALVAAIPQAPREQAHRLIRFLVLAHTDASGPLVRTLISQLEDPEGIMASLRVLSDGSDLDAVRVHLFHSRWEVRVRAVDALGRLGSAHETGNLVAMLSDPEWWVRYRAAQALCRLLEHEPDTIARHRNTLHDRFARDMLAHVVAERGHA